MRRKAFKFDPNRTLPENWVISSSGHHFYRSGFSQYRNGCTDRSKLYHPLLVFTIALIIILRCLYSALTSPKTNYFHLLIGDWCHFIDMRIHMNMTVFFGLGMAYLSLVIQYYEYIGNRGQPYMNVFNMMSGQITPHSIGLNDENTINDILKKTKICFKLIDIFLFSIPIPTLMI